MTTAASDVPSSASIASPSASPQPEKPSYAAYSWVICVAIMGTVAFISNFGMNAQKLALMRSAKIDPDAPDAKSQYRKWKLFWLVGMACIVCSAGGDTVALNFGAQSVVAPLSSLTLVANAIIARAMHGELMTNRDYAATGLIIIGCVLSVAFAQHKDTLYCAEVIWNQFSTAGVIIYLLIICIVVFAGMLFSKWAERVRTELGADSALYLKWGKLHRFSYAAVSGICGAQSVLFMKILIELFTNTTQQASQTGTIFLGMWQTYPLIMALVACVALQIYWLNLGLARFDALYNVPVFQCFWMLFGVIAGGVFFHEFATFSAFQATMFTLGVSFCLAGVAVLSSRETAEDNKDSTGDDDDDGESGDDDDLSQSLLGSDTGSSTSDYSTDSSTTGISQSVSFDASDYPNRIELPEIDAIFYRGPMGLGLCPEIVKITHPQYERVQGMVKVWRIRDFGTASGVGGDGGGVGAKVRSQSEGGSAGSSGDSGVNERNHTNTSSNGSAELSAHGQAEEQGLRPGMMLVGINGESILRQRNTWRETLLRVTNARRPVVLTFRDIPGGVGLLPPNADSTAADSGSVRADQDVEPGTPSGPSTPASTLRGSRDVEYGLSTPSTNANAFVDMVHAGQISLSENRRRTMDARGRLRYAPKSTDGRIRYEKLHGSYHRDQLSRVGTPRHQRGHSARGGSVGRGTDRQRQRRRSATAASFLTGDVGTGVDVLAAHESIRNRPLLGGSLAMLHQPGSMRLDTFDRSATLSSTGPSPRTSQTLNSALEPQVHPLAEFADSISRGMPPVLDRALDLLTGSRSGTYAAIDASSSHKSMPALHAGRDRSWSSNLGERPSSDSSLMSRREGTKSVGSISPEDADALARLVGDASPRNSDAETRVPKGVAVDSDTAAAAEATQNGVPDGGELVFGE
jgi:hypothetical protein